MRPAPSQELIDLARQLRSQGLTLRAIGKRVGRCESTVYSWVGIATGDKVMPEGTAGRPGKPTRVDDPRVVKCVQLREQRVSLRGVCAQVGVSQPTVYKFLRAAGREDLINACTRMEKKV